MIGTLARQGSGIFGFWEYLGGKMGLKDGMLGF